MMSFKEKTKDMKEISIEDWDENGLHELWVESSRMKDKEKPFYGGVDEFFDIRIKGIPKKHSGCEWTQRIKEEIKFFNINEGSVLDVGCGTGEFLSLIKKKKLVNSVYGIEISESGIRLCKEKYNLKNIFKVNLNRDKFPFKDKFFDNVVISHVLEHVSDPYFVMKECERVLKDDGILHIAVPRSVDERMYIVLPNGMMQTFPEDKQSHDYFYQSLFTLRGFLNFLNMKNFKFKIKDSVLTGLFHINQHWLWFNVEKERKNE